MNHQPDLANSADSAGAVSPVTGAQRIVSIDVLRGFAVLGILVMNIQSYSMIGSTYSNPHAYGDLTGFNYVVWYLSHLLCDMKFMALFSMLFGAGIIVMQTRREQQGLPCAGFPLSAHRLSAVVWAHSCLWDLVRRHSGRLFDVRFHCVLGQRDGGREHSSSFLC